MKSINPATNEVIAHYEAYSQDKASHIVDNAHKAYTDWRYSAYSTRAKLLYNVADVLEKNASDYAQLMTSEMGKVIQEGESEIKKCADVCRYYAEHGEQFLTREPVENSDEKAFVSYQPLGVILAIMPWNFPFWQVFRFAAPTIMAGNSAVLKHASNVSGCALAIEQIFNDAGAPEHLFRTLLVKGEDTKAIIEHKHIQAVTLTGSTEAGKKVAATAGAALKKTVLELGGSDAYVVLEDADIAHAAKCCTQSRLINAGQSCIAAKRMIVVDAVYDAFLETFTHEMQAITMGNPLDKACDIGPQASTELRDQLHAQVQASIKAGAKCVLGGEIPSQAGAFYPPSILVDVDENCPAYHEELFGPVATIIRAKNEADAIRIANDSVFGLGSAVFTNNIERGMHIAEFELQAGSSVVNDFVKSDPLFPFGGIKQSGYGRELSSFGMREFVNIKTVRINVAGQ